MSRPTILSAAMLAIGVILGAGAFAVGQKAADRRAEPGRYTANTHVSLAGIGAITEITDHHTNTLYVYYGPMVQFYEGQETPELKCTIDLTSAGQPNLRVTQVNQPKKDEPKKDEPKNDKPKS
jgi:hypothetical protein